MADIPGLIEGASEGIGLGYQFLRHIERCKVLIHVVDAAGIEGRDPLTDIETIDRELEKYDPEIRKRPLLIAANKTDLLIDEQGTGSAVTRLKEKYEPQGIRVIPISAATNTGLPELLEEAWKMLQEAGSDATVYESEFDLSLVGNVEMLPIEYANPEKGLFTVEGPKIEKMLGYTNLEAEKGFRFFQEFMVKQGVIKTLKKMGMQEGDTIRIYGHEFEYLDTEEYDGGNATDYVDTEFWKRRAVKEEKNA